MLLLDYEKKNHLLNQCSWFSITSKQKAISITRKSNALILSTKLKQEHDVHLLFTNKKKNKRKRFYILIVLFSKLNSAINIVKLVIFTYLNKSPHEIFHRIKK